MDAISLKRPLFRRNRRAMDHMPTLPEVETSLEGIFRQIIREELAYSMEPEPNPNPYYAPPELFSNAS